jgi:hypothetical protein
MSNTHPIVVSDDEDSWDDLDVDSNESLSEDEDDLSERVWSPTFTDRLFPDEPCAKKRKLDEESQCIVCFDGEKEGNGFTCHTCQVWTHFIGCFEGHLEIKKEVSCLNCFAIIPRSQWELLGFPIILKEKMEAVWKANQIAEDKKSDALILKRAQGRIAAAPLIAMVKETSALKRELEMKLAGQRALLREQLFRVQQIESGNESIQVSSVRCFSSLCEGFLNFEMECILCKKSFCRDCQSVSHPSEPCNEAAQASISLIQLDTKCCPNQACQERIFRIEGCFQMWCIKCKTFFDWTTGKILLDPSVKHNPHYIEWKNEQEVEMNLNPLVDEDGMPRYDFVENAHDQKLSDSPKWRETAGIRHFVDKVSQDVKSLRNYLRQYHEKRVEAGIKYTLCKLGESSDTDLKMADAKRHETVFKYADQQERIQVLLNIYLSEKKSLTIHLRNYLQDANLETLHTECYELQQNINRRIDALTFLPPMGIGYLFAFF